MSEETQVKPGILLGLRVVLVASLVLFLLATLSETYRSPANDIEVPPTERSTPDSLIVPGVRVGPVTLGLPVTQLSQYYGKAQLRPHEDGIVHLFEEHGLVVYAEQDRVQQVTVRSPHYKTRAGVGVGSDVDAVLQNLGQDYEKVGSQDKYVLHNWNHGWHTGIENDKVTYFQITPTLSGAH